MRAGATLAPLESGGASRAIVFRMKSLHSLETLDRHASSDKEVDSSAYRTVSTSRKTRNETRLDSILPSNGTAIHGTKKTTGFALAKAR